MALQPALCRWTMTSPSKPILVVPRPEGVLISIDGVSYYKDMTSNQLLWMAERFLKAGLEAANEEKTFDPKGRKQEEDNL
jgi:hypothetical protein